MIARARRRPFPFHPHKMRNLPSQAKLRKQSANENPQYRLQNPHITQKHKCKSSPWAYPRTFLQKNGFNLHKMRSQHTASLLPQRERATLYLLRRRLDAAGSRGPNLAGARITSARFFLFFLIQTSRARAQRKQAPPTDRRP